MADRGVGTSERQCRKFWGENAIPGPESGVEITIVLGAVPIPEFSTPEFWKMTKKWELNGSS
jgi:hypothetical protein